MDWCGEYIPTLHQGRIGCLERFHLEPTRTIDLLKGDLSEGDTGDLGH